MHSVPTASERLIALCKNGEREQLLLELQHPTTVQIVLSEEEVVYDSEFNRSRMQLNLLSMLQAAAGAGYADTVDLLLGFGQQHNADLLDLVTECLSAAMRVNPLQVLLKFHAFVPETFSLRFHHSGTVVEIACCSRPCSEPEPGWKSLSLVRYFMENGFNPNWKAPSSPSRPLHYAIRNASCAVVECLLEHGALIGDSIAPRLAAQKGRIDVLEALLRHGTDLNEYTPERDFQGPSGTLLHVAVASNQNTTVKWLLRRGIDVSACNGEGKKASDLISGDSDEGLKILFNAI